MCYISASLRCSAYIIHWIKFSNIVTNDGKTNMPVRWSGRSDNL